MIKKDGGPAFPMYSEIGNLHSEGITVRDYFAAAALPAIITLSGFDSVIEEDVSTAYKYADLMLAERDKQ